ncbi:MAG TPA: DUF2336 domain-containing protein [Xanthobacteraceae bacterium]|nr:DUF2336 domain-containing protein [Xanthobacteraceae bacterium]
MNARHSLISELEVSLRSGSRDDRVTSLRRVTDLFLATSDRLNDEQIEVFDDVLSRLMEHVETKALSEFSQRIAPIDTAPNDVVQTLARNDEAEVAEPVLTQSKRLSNDDLIEIAETKGQSHLRAISSRKQLAAPVTDALLRHGDRDVVDRLAGNAGASFSDDGYTRMVDSAVENESIAEKLSRRVDIPLKQFRDLILRATESVRTRVLSIATPKDISEMQYFVSSVDSEKRVPEMHDFTAAHKLVMQMQKDDKLNNEAILKFARAEKYEELVASLSVRCAASLKLVEKLMRGEGYNALLVPCRAAGLDWMTVRSILKTRPCPMPISERELGKANSEYAKLSQQTAVRVMSFWQAREKAS